MIQNRLVKYFVVTALFATSGIFHAGCYNKTTAQKYIAVNISAKTNDLQWSASFISYENEKTAIFLAGDYPNFSINELSGTIEINNESIALPNINGRVYILNKDYTWIPISDVEADILYDAALPNSISANHADIDESIEDVDGSLISDYPGWLDIENELRRHQW